MQSRNFMHSLARMHMQTASYHTCSSLPDPAELLRFFLTQKNSLQLWKPALLLFLLR